VARPLTCQCLHEYRHLGPDHVGIAGDVPREILRQEPVIVDDRPGKPPLAGKAIRDMRVDRARADKYGPPGVRRVAPRQTGGEIALELKMYFCTNLISHRDGRSRALWQRL
jgi:hypothetical protein